MDILLIDNTDLYRGILQQALGSNPEFQLHFAATAEEGLRLAENNDFSFIAVSRNLPDADGLDVARRLRDFGKYIYEPIVILTSSPTEKLNFRAIRAGVTEVFRKQDIDEMVTFLNRFLAIYSPIYGRVLYIEDEKSQRQVMGDLLRSWGLRVDAFATAEEGWSAFQRSDYDLVICDVVLGGRMSGSRFINRIRRTHGNKGNVLVLALSSVDNSARRVELFHMGADDYLIKPVTPTELLVRIQSMLSRKRAADRNNLLLSISGMGVVTLDAGGVILSFNAEAERIFGLTEREVSGRPISLLLDDQSGEEGQRLLAMLTDYPATDERHGEFAARRRDGEPFPAEIAVTESMFANARRQYALLVRDLSREKELERRLREAKEEAERTTRMKSEFLANMSHEIRTPMNAVIGLSHLCLRTELSQRQRDYLEKIERSAQSLLGLINDILDLSKIEAGKLVIESHPFDLPTLARELIDVAAMIPHGKRLELRLELDTALPRRVIGDRLRLHQVLLNLLSNAVKFTPSGEVTLAVIPDPDTDGGLRFAVRDTGLGIAPEDQARLFKAFEQVDGSTTRNFGGTGLGLAICRQLVQRMGGELAVESRVDEGSSFHFTLPLEPAEERPGEAAESEESPREALRHIAGARLLVVEDNEINRQIVQELLGSVGLAVECAENGAEALERLESAPYDLVLMDLQMPVMDGFEATRRIRAQEEHAELPIVAMTAHAMAEERERCLNVGMNDHLAKPIEIDELHAALLRWIPPRTAAEAEPTAPATEETLPDTLPGVDLAAGLGRVAGNPKLYLALLRSFAEKHRDEATAVGAALAAGRRDEARQIAHTVKGVAANLGAAELSEAAARLERQLTPGAEIPPAEDEGLSGALSRFGNRLEQLIDGLDTLPTEAPAAAAPALDTDRVQPLLAELERLLESDLSEAMERAERLRPLLAEGPLGGDYHQLAAALGDYDTDEAHLAVRRLHDALLPHPSSRNES